MSLNVKNPETVRLVATLARRLNTTQVQAINDAVSARLAELQQPSRPSLDSLLEAIWADLPADEVRAIQERQETLYDEMGLPA